MAYDTPLPVLPPAIWNAPLFVASWGGRVWCYCTAKDDGSTTDVTLGHATLFTPLSLLPF